MDASKSGKVPKKGARRRTHEGEWNNLVQRIKEELARPETAEEIAEADAWHASLPEYVPITNEPEVHHVTFMTKRPPTEESMTARSRARGWNEGREIDKERPPKDWYSLADVQNDNAVLRAIIKDLIREPIFDERPGHAKVYISVEDLKTIHEVLGEEMRLE